MMRLLIGIVTFSGILAACPTLVSAADIEWRVENPFRFFTNSKHTEAHRVALSFGNSVLDAERILAKTKPFGWAEGQFRETCWDLFRQDHNACGGLDAYINPRSHRIIARLGGRAYGSKQCVWSFSVSHSSRSSNAKRVTASCDAEVGFDVPYPAGGSLRVAVSGGPTVETVVRVQDLFIVGLGDSFASGEGNPDRPVRWRDDQTSSFGKISDTPLDGYPARKNTPITYRGRRFYGPSAFWLSQPCHRSLYSHQLRAALKLSFENPHRAVTFLGLACSGAQITSGLLSAWKGVERFPNRPRRSQIGEAARAQCGGRRLEFRNYASSFTDGGRVPSLEALALERCPPREARKIDLVLLSIGGNDIGFAKLVAYAILQERSSLRAVSRVTEQLFTPADARARFSELKSRFKLLRRAFHNHLHIPWKEPFRIVLTGYPSIAAERGRSQVCSDRNGAGLDGFPGYRLDRRRTAEAERVASELNDLLKRVATSYGWGFADAHLPKFVGRGICAGVEGGRGGSVDELMLPRWSGRWSPYAPSAYRPYASRDRWMRTSNDSFLTTHIDVSTDLRRRIRRRKNFSPADLLKASTFGGAFHPTAEGQAAMADAVLPVASRVIEKRSSK
ncbi:MAG: hypothetical protein RIC14_04630 [Filomicrobium sp.]